MRNRRAGAIVRNFWLSGMGNEIDMMRAPDVSSVASFSAIRSKISLPSPVALTSTTSASPHRILNMSQLTKDTRRRISFDSFGNTCRSTWLCTNDRISTPTEMTVSVVSVASFVHARSPQGGWAITYKAHAMTARPSPEPRSRNFSRFRDGALSNVSLSDWHTVWHMLRKAAKWISPATKFRPLTLLLRLVASTMASTSPPLGLASFPTSSKARRYCA
mmetsp:Transcript_68411/g.111062  ORF Transcript_68411/g.111062 Transcript_68411/m.111062 type:complete len:218 (+) Transcript_68411:137-790(+)